MAPAPIISLTESPRSISFLDHGCPSMDNMEEMPRNWAHGPGQIAGPAWKQLQLYR